MSQITLKRRERTTCWVGAMSLNNDNATRSAVVTINHWVGEKRAEHTMYYLYYGSEEATIEIVKEKGEDWKTFVSVFKGSLPEAFKQENIREAGPIGEKQAMAFVESLKGAKRIPIEVALKKRS